MPDPVGYSPELLAAFNRLNELRAQAGLGLVRQSVELDRAAGAHANWIALNNSFGHVESEGSPGFTGVQPWNRFDAAGYLTQTYAEALTSFAVGSASPDLLVSGVYHRQAILGIAFVDVGLGVSSEDYLPHPLVIDFATPQNDPGIPRGQRMRSSMVPMIVWPFDGATNVFTRNGTETPYPLPAGGVAGLSPSVTVDPASVLRVDEFSLFEEFSGQEVDCVLLMFGEDQNSMIASNYAAIVPKAPLLVSTSYLVRFRGGIDSMPVTKVWRFSTSDVDGPQ